MRPLRRPASLGLVVLALAMPACGKHDPGSYSGDPSLDPAGVVREYVRAIDERNGSRFCELVAPYISGRYDLATEDPDNPFPGMDGCPEFVSKFIGYVEDCCPDVLKGAELRRIVSDEHHGRLRRVRARIRLDLEGMGIHKGPFVKTIEDELWLARFDGSWRVAQLDHLAGTAGLPDPWRSGDLYADETAAADLAEKERAFAKELARAKGTLRRESYREPAYAKPSPARTCGGAADKSDPSRDQELPPGVAGTAPESTAGDLVRVQVKADRGRVCVSWELAAPPTGRVSLNYVHRAGSGYETFGQSFVLELRADGSARVTSGRDDYGQPIPVPAAIGVSGSRLSMTLSRASFTEGQRDWLSKERPPLRRFGFSASAAATLADGRILVDGLGDVPNETFRYPDGRPCPEERC